MKIQRIIIKLLLIKMHTPVCDIANYTKYCTFKYIKNCHIFIADKQDLN